MDEGYYDYERPYGQYPYENSDEYGRPYPPECNNTPVGPHNFPTLNGAQNRNKSFNSTPVVMLYNIDIKKMNCDRLVYFSIIL